MTHTPLQYRKSDAVNHQFILFEPDGNRDTWGLVFAEEKAQEIVRCVNAHEKLVEALKRAKVRVAAAEVGIPIDYKPTLAQIDAALSAAEAE